MWSSRFYKLFLSRVMVVVLGFCEGLFVRVLYVAGVLIGGASVLDIAEPAS